MIARIRENLKLMSGEQLLLLRILWGDRVLGHVDYEIDRRARMKAGCCRRPAGRRDPSFGDARNLVEPLFQPGASPFPNRRPGPAARPKSPIAL